jgi:hypothetical protein
MSLNLNPPNPRRRPCRVRTIAETLTPEDRDTYYEAINNQATWTARTLATQLRANGLDISESPIWHHRKGDCTC